MIWSFVGLTAALLTMFGFVPQIVKIIKTQSGNDVSRITLAQFFIGTLMWILYGIHLKDIIIIFANIITLICVSTAFVLLEYYYYQNTKKPVSSIKEEI